MSLRAQTETKYAYGDPDNGGPEYHLGFSIFENDGVWTGVLHARTYEGVKVTSEYSTASFVLDGATDFDSALERLKVEYRGFARIYGKPIVR